MYLLHMSHLLFAVQIFNFPQPEKAMFAVYIGFIVVFLVGLAGKSLPSFLGVSESNQMSVNPIETSTGLSEVVTEETQE